MKAIDKLSRFPDISIKTSIFFGVNAPHLWESCTNYKDWHAYMDIRLTKKDEVKTLYTVTPPLWLKERVKKQYRFKTTSYKELCTWLKEHEDIITKPQDDWNLQDRLW